MHRYGFHAPDADGSLIWVDYVPIVRRDTRTFAIESHDPKPRGYGPLSLVISVRIYQCHSILTVVIPIIQHPSKRNAAVPPPLVEDTHSPRRIWKLAGVNHGGRCAASTRNTGSLVSLFL